VRSLRQWIDFTGRDHFHHRLAALRIGNLGAVIVVYIVTLWLGLSALALKTATGYTVAIELLESGIVFVLMAFFMIFVPQQYAAIETDKSQASDSQLD
jgi:UDP-GlcNAc:undecaprenyl-phosphate/decaprenyl-phosphate GlcNAc-1-phosphate transferase